MGRYKFYECPETGQRFILKNARPRYRTGNRPNAPGKAERIEARRREPRAKAAPTPTTRVEDATREEVLAIGVCAFCGSRKDLSVDHIIPRSMGGGNHRANLQCLCKACNHWKDNTIITPEQYAMLTNREKRRIAKQTKAHHAARHRSNERNSI